MKMFIRNALLGAAGLVACAGTCGWLGDSRGHAASQIEHERSSSWPSVPTIPAPVVSASRSRRGKSSGAAAVNRALRSQRRQCRLQEDEEEKGEEVRLISYDPLAALKAAAVRKRA